MSPRKVARQRGFNNISFLSLNFSKKIIRDSINKVKPQKHGVLANRLESIHQEHARQERIRREKEIKEARIRREKEERERKEARINFKLKRFSLTEEEAEILFGRIWKKRFARTDEEFFERELSRMSEKCLNDAESYLSKIASVAEKFFDIMEYYVLWYNKKYNGWDEFDCANWTEDWDEVRQTWGRGRHKHKKHYSNYDKNHESKETQEIHTVSDAFDILGLDKTATALQIKQRFRKLILKYHPDKNSSANAEEMTRKITLAYEFLKKRGFAYTEAAI